MTIISAPPATCCREASAKQVAGKTTPPATCCREASAKQVAGKTTPPVIQDLTSQLRQLERSGRMHSSRPSWHQERIRLDDSVSTGIDAFDAILPTGGFRPGTMTEWLVGSRGSAACSLTLCLAAQCVRENQALAIVDFVGDFYPPAAPALGIDLRRTIIVRCEEKKIEESSLRGRRRMTYRQKTDGFWALEQLVRSTAIGAVWCNLGHTSADSLGASRQRFGQFSDRELNSASAKLAGLDRSCLNIHSDSRLYRRLQLACEAGDCVCFVMRPASFLRQPSWADLRFLLTPLKNRGDHLTSVNVELIKSRDGFRSGSLNVLLPNRDGLSDKAGKVATATSLIQSLEIGSGIIERETTQDAR